MGPAQKASTAAATSASASGSSAKPSTMSTSTSTSEPPIPSIEKLPANISHLEPDGSNWAIFQLQFHDVMKVNRHWGYFTGTKKCPGPADPSNVTEDKGKKIEAWEYSDS